MLDYKYSQEIAVKQRMHVLTTASGSDDSANGSNGDSYQNGNHQQQLVQQQRQNLEFERSLLLEREERMTGIQSSVLDINAIMQQLGTMAQVQGSNIGKCCEITTTQNYLNNNVCRLPPTNRHDRRQHRPHDRPGRAGSERVGEGRPPAGQIP